MSWAVEVVASADLVARAGGREFEIGWTCPHVPDEEDNHNCDGVSWWAHAQWKGGRLTAEGHRTPADAATALAVRVLDGASCRCGRTVTLAGGEPGCRWVLSGDRWEPGCDADPIPVASRHHGDVPAMRQALNREQRRRRARGRG